VASSTRTVNVKFDGDAKGLAKAAKDGEREVDRFSKSVDKKFSKSGDDSGKGFAAGLKKWFSPSALGKTGKEGGTVFGSGFLGAIKTPVLGPAILAALAGAVAVALPAVGAIAASGLVLGFGAGLAGLGLVFAAKSAQVKAAWQKTLSGMGRDMTLLSKPFESTLISIAGFAQRTFDKFKPSLEAVFKEMAPAVTKFADQVSRGLESLQPAIRPLAEAFDAVLASLGPAIQGAIGNVSKGLQNLAESVKKNPDGLADLVDGVGNLTGKLLDGISALNDINGAFERFTGGTSLVDVVMGKANSTIGRFLGTVKDTIDPLGSLKNGLDDLFGSASKTTGEVGLTGDAVKYFTQGLDENQVKAFLASKTTDSLGRSVDALTAKFNAQLAVTRADNAELFKKSGLLLSLSGASIGYEQAIDDATASLKENGKTLDIHTAKGRANRTALDNLATAANSQTEAMRNAGDGNVSAAKHAEGARGAFVKQATQMGLSKKEAEKLAASLIAIPNVTRTAKLNANITDLEGKLASAKKKLADPKLTAEQKAKLNADITKLEAGIKRAKGLIAGVPSSKTVTIKYTSTGVNLTTPSSVGRKASGGLTQPRRQYLVGERGPEILTMGGSGGRITSNEQLNQGGDSGPLIVENHIEIGGEVVKVIRTEIKASNRDLKRMVRAG